MSSHPPFYPTRVLFASLWLQTDDELSFKFLFTSLAPVWRSFLAARATGQHMETAWDHGASLWTLEPPPFLTSIVLLSTGRPQPRQTVTVNKKLSFFCFPPRSSPRPSSAHPSSFKSSSCWLLSSRGRAWRCWRGARRATSCKQSSGCSLLSAAESETRRPKITPSASHTNTQLRRGGGRVCYFVQRAKVKISQGSLDGWCGWAQDVQQPSCWCDPTCEAKAKHSWKWSFMLESWSLFLWVSLDLDLLNSSSGWFTESHWLWWYVM